MRIELIANKIRSVIEKRSITFKQAADEIGVNQNVVGRIVKKKQSWVQPAVADKITKWLARHGEKIKNEAVAVDPNIQEVIVYGMAQACTLENPPCDIMPQVHDSELPTIAVRVSNGHRIAAFRVEGDSMAPKLADGMFVICDCDAEIMNGNIVVAKFDGKAVIKRYHRAGDMVYLNSDNSTGKNYELHASEFITPKGWIIKVLKYQGDA